MELSKNYIEIKNKQYKINIKTVAKRKGKTLKDLSEDLGMKSNYISNMCGKKDTIMSNNLLHRIAIHLECNMSELNNKI